MGLFSGRKGSLTLTVMDRAYNPGEEIPVAVRLKTKKDLGPGRLYVALVLIETVRRRVESRQSDGSTRTRTDTDKNELFRHEVDLAVEASFPAGSNLSFDGHFQVPESPGQRNQVNVADSAPSWVGALADVANALNSTQRQTQWHIEARYDIPRLDLKDRQEISVNV